MYEIDGKSYNPDSIANQRIKDRFVQREVYACCTTLVEYCLEQSMMNGDVNSPFDWTSKLESPEMVECAYCGCVYHGEETEMMLADDVTIDEDPEADLEDRFLCPVCGLGWSSEDEAKKCCDHSIVYICPDCNRPVIVQDADPFEQDPLEWWFVSAWLAEKLAAHGEIVLESIDGFLYAWGRQTSGQSISLDGVIHDVCYDLELLEGQSYFREVV